MKSNNVSTNYLLICIGVLFSSTNIFAQDSSTDHSFYQQSLANAMAVYHQSFGNQSALYNGNKYGGYLFQFKEGQPFFYSTEPVAGSVRYDGILYDGVTMRYDEITDVLVINNRADRIQLLSDKVESFSLHNSVFIRLVKDSLSQNLVSSGFYNLLYEGKTSLLKKQIKTIREEISPIMELERFVDSKDHYYIKKLDTYYPIKSRRNLLTVLGDRKKEVQRFIKANKLNFKKDRQNMLTQVTGFYDSLNK